MSNEAPGVPFVPVPLGGSPFGPSNAPVKPVSAEKVEREEPVGPGTDVEKPVVKDKVTPPSENLVPVVRPNDADEDFSSWDVAVGGGLLWLAASGRKKDEGEQTPDTPDFALRETVGWEHTSRHSTSLGAMEHPRGSDPYDYMPRPFVPPDGPVCSDAGLRDEPEEDPETRDEDEEQDEPERKAVDLLTQDEDVWAASPRPNALGVIE
ncbi:hypothetical protein SAMN05192558_12613 [Actinokineospora alba]|uniref:Uncharacterized protein n=4 Tax=Actinokineospora alba TaxID=504798 RepID=A0A1H0WNA4_9PSEU|nr:hypothetical protein C8E96_2708 [Actinokineospora alba]SDJ54408.1 hypothetical protein SAMN05421871_12013 [Actinokineospora alba]SDP92204.1 hypothetical protein SAMN05192558_12613 [Actinokineospora alba]